MERQAARQAALPYRPIDRIPRYSPWTILAVLWGGLCPSLLVLLAWLSGTYVPAAPAEALRLALLVPLTLPLLVVLAVFAWLGRKFFVHN